MYQTYLFAFEYLFENDILHYFKMNSTVPYSYLYFIGSTVQYSTIQFTISWKSFNVCCFLLKLHLFLTHRTRYAVSRRLICSKLYCTQCTVHICFILNLHTSTTCNATQRIEDATSMHKIRVEQPSAYFGVADRSNVMLMSNRIRGMMELSVKYCTLNCQCLSLMCRLCTA